MLERSPRQFVAVLVSILVVTGMMPAVAVGAFTENATDPQEAISGNNFRDVSDDIEVWERAALPLRANPQVNADTSFRSVDLRATVNELQIDNVPLDKDRTAVYDDQAEIQLQFESKTVASTSDFANQDVQLMAVHIEEDTQAARDLLDSSSTLTAADALDLITEDDINNNTHVDLVENYGTTDSDGEITKRYDLGDENRGAGFYVFFLVQDHKGNDNWGVTDKGFEVSMNGDLSVKNESRVLGVDVATVHQQEADADPEQNRYNPGSDITFDVDAKQGGDVTHAVAVYKRTGNDGFEGKDVTVEVSGDLDEDFSADQVTVVREIEDVNGVAKVSGNPDIFGLGNLQDGQVSGLIAGSRIIDFVVEQANADGPLGDVTNNPKTLDASVTVIDGPSDGTVTVETFGNWSTGQYGYVYVATGDDSSEITTTQGTININPSVTRSRNVQGGGPTNIQFPGNADVSEVGLTFTNDVSGEVRVDQRVSPPSKVPTVKRQKGLEDPVYFDITSPSGGGQTTIEMTVKKSKLRGLATNMVSIWHYIDGEWVELETEIVSQSGNTVTLRAVTDEFSPFAIAEATEPNEEIVTDNNNNDDDDSGPSVSSGSGGGGGGASLGSRTIFAVTDFITGGSSVSLDVSGSSDTLERIELRFFDRTAGQVRVEERNRPSLDENYQRNYDDTIVTVVDVAPPNRVASEPGSVTFELKRSAVDALGVTAADLQIQQFDSESGTWETLSTEVVEAEGDTVTLRADVSSFGTYVVSTVPGSASADGSTGDSTGDSTDTPEADQSDATTDDDGFVETVTGTATLRPGETVRPAETTETQFPGLGVGTALVAFVLALVLGWRRRQ